MFLGGGGGGGTCPLEGNHTLVHPTQIKNPVRKHTPLPGSLVVVTIQR